MSDTNWAIKPRTGLGQLKFGMSPEAVDALKAVYGTIVGGGSMRIPDDILKNTIEELGAGMSDAEKQSLIELYADLGPTNSQLSEARGDNSLILNYEKNELYSITVFENAINLSIENAFLFAEPRLIVLQILEKLNKSPGLYFGETAYFDNLLIDIYGFSRTSADQKVTIIPAVKNQDGPAVTISNVPSSSEDVLSKFFRFSFL